MTGNSKLVQELANFLARRGEYEDDQDVYASRVEDLRSPSSEEEEDRWVATYALAEGGRTPYIGHDTGVKNDAGKAPLSFLGHVGRALGAVARSLAHGAVKYSPDNWQRVPDGSRRYRDAALRHLFADLRGEQLDPEQNLPHVAIAALNLLLAAEHDIGFDDDDDDDDDDDSSPREWWVETSPPLTPRGSLRPPHRRPYAPRGSK